MAMLRRTCPTIHSCNSPRQRRRGRAAPKKAQRQTPPAHLPTTHSQQAQMGMRVREKMACSRGQPLRRQPCGLISLANKSSTQQASFWLKITQPLRRTWYAAASAHQLRVCGAHELQGLFLKFLRNGFDPLRMADTVPFRGSNSALCTVACLHAAVNMLCTELSLPIRMPVVLDKLRTCDWL